MRALWKISIAINPVVAVEMRDVASVVLTLCLVIESALRLEIDPKLLASCHNEWNIELVSVERSNDRGFVHLNELEELFQSGLF